MRKKTFTLGNAEVARFRNKTCLCIGTGRMGLALQKEYFEQLKLVQENIGFKWIRGHGLFNEDMAIYQEYKTEDGAIVPEYNFTYLDFVIDSYLELGIRPFIELGFMPHAIASGDQSVFYWRGNVTPPKEYADWNKLVATTLRHLIDRYGADEVTSWPVEVWNEPNLAHFWKDADRKEYFRLFRETIFTVKSVDKRFRVGGPAICGVDDISWLKDFLNYCRDEKLPLDFVTRHLYNITVPERDGKYGYPKLSPLSRAFAETDRSRKIIDNYPEYRGMEMHVTEFSTRTRRARRYTTRILTPRISPTSLHILAIHVNRTHTGRLVTFLKNREYPSRLSMEDSVLSQTEKYLSRHIGRSSFLRIWEAVTAFTVQKTRLS
jgi:xylan 1,4-beta-xylosidase